MRSCLLPGLSSSRLQRKNMRHDEHRRLTICNAYSSFPLLIILNLFISLTWALAQEPFSVPSISTPRPSVTMPPKATFESISVTLSSALSSPVFPVITNQPPLKTLPDLFIAAEQPQQQVEVKNRVFNYYFLFLALLAATVAALLWWVHRHRRREQEQLRLRGQHALARDVEGWAISRRNQPPIVEGLNESGEAPPPYKPKDDTLTTLEPVSMSSELVVDVAVPPRALSRNEAEHVRLPDYVETVATDDSDRSTEPARPVAQTVAARADNGTNGRTSEQQAEQTGRR